MSAKWHVHRRTFLRGLGAAVALPVLDAMAPSLASVTRAASAATGGAAGGAPFPKRMAFVYVPNGVTIPHWTPKAIGANYELPRILQPLAAHKHDFNILSGFAQSQGLALGDGAGDHARASASFLTGAHARKTSGADIRAGVSVDQIAAEQIGKQTVLPSLELSCDLGRRVGACDSGYSCAYQYNLAWRSETMPVMPEVDPKQVFERLFGDVNRGGGGIDAADARSRRAMFQRSILDFVADDAARLQSRLGRTDQRKLDEYLTAVREIEKRVELAEKSAPRLPDGTRPPDEFNSFEEHVRLMFDMLVLAFQTDSTRVATFIVSHEGSNRSYGEIGVNDGHHNLSHHFGDVNNIEKLTQINEFHAKQFAYFLDRMKSVTEGDRTLLDNSMVVYGSGLGDGNAHNHDNLPILLAGRGGGTVTPGRHIKADDRTPLNNLFLSMLDRVGAKAERFGDSTGRYEAIA
ncbi:MAG TPA: DUF1552 domain-containing protein [Tepidisphaeraceae bacterium]|nr:DUF1552 domain-containing protein [Tepidisphaeraceae bacterium]